MNASIVAERRNHVAVLTVHDPDRRNALTVELSEELARLVRECEQDNEIGAIVVTGAPPAFCAGADLTALGGAGTSDGLRRIYAGFLALADCALPTVAAVNGAAVGAGLNLALACDLRIAGPRARFDARFLQLGIHPGGGMTWMVQRAVGAQTAAAMVLFGEILDAEQAARAGLVWRRVDGEPADVVNAAVTLAAKAAEAPRGLLTTTKATMRTTSTLSEHAPAVEIELAPQAASLDSPEFAARLSALKTKISRK